VVSRFLTIRLACISLACACAPAQPPAGAPLPASPEPSPELQAAELARPPAQEISGLATESTAATANQRIGANDLLEIKVLEDAELNRNVRVSGDGEISLPLLGEIGAAGQSARELELELESLLRERFILDPHVTVQILEAESQSVSVVGAVNRPGVFQIRGPRTLLEVLALAGGLSEKAGDGVLVVRGSVAHAIATGEAVAADSQSGVEEIDLKALLESGELRHNVAVRPGDVVKVKPAGLIYVVGEVNQPGAFQLERGSGLTVLQAIALGEGLRSMAAKGRTTIIRTSPAGERIEIPVDLGDVLAGRALDPTLQERDILFVPNSATRALAVGVVDALVRMVTLRGIF
jgi:polysaccharide biosynthesis/export protein